MAKSKALVKSSAGKAARVARGRAWGNALGGYKTQRRDAHGRFAGSGKSVAAKTTIIRSGGSTKNALNPKAEYKKRKATKASSVPKAVPGSKAVLGKADAVARRRGGGVVPYARQGVGHTTVGVNSGIRVTKNRRISAGFYVRTDSLATQKRVSKALKADQAARDRIGGKLAVGQHLNGGRNLPVEVSRSSIGVNVAGRGRVSVKIPKAIGNSRAGRKILGAASAATSSGAANSEAIRTVRDKAVRKAIGRERNIAGTTGFVRAGTDRNGLPVVAVQFNSPKGKKVTSRKARDSGTVAYNTAANRARGKKVANPRPQRRGKGN